MTVYVNIGRRVPKKWYKRIAQVAVGMVTFQENLWLMINQSLNLAKRRANESKLLSFVLTKDRESEDINYDIEWIKIVIRGTPDQELEEYNESMGLYKPFAKLFKKEMSEENKTNIKKHFNSKIMSVMEIDEAYKEGYGCLGDTSMHQKMLEMGILTHIKKLDDFKTRDVINTDTTVE